MIEPGSVWERSVFIGGIPAGSLVIVERVNSREVQYRFVDAEDNNHSYYSRHVSDFQKNFKEVKHV